MATLSAGIRVYPLISFKNKCDCSISLRRNVLPLNHASCRGYITLNHHHSDVIMNQINAKR